MKEMVKVKKRKKMEMKTKEKKWITWNLNLLKTAQAQTKLGTILALIRFVLSAGFLVAALIMVCCVVCLCAFFGFCNCPHMSECTLDAHICWTVLNRTSKENRWINLSVNASEREIFWSELIYNNPQENEMKKKPKVFNGMHWIKCFVYFE